MDSSVFVIHNVPFFLIYLLTSVPLTLSLIHKVGKDCESIDVGLLWTGIIIGWCMLTWMLFIAFPYWY